MKLKKMLCLLLCLSIVLCISLPAAFAVENVVDAPDKEPDDTLSPTVCENCGQMEDHAQTCPWYTAPVSACEDCGQIGGHSEVCPQADSTITEDENACTCGEDAPENLSQHLLSCPRRQYIFGLLQSETGGYKTAIQIYAAWDTYDKVTQKDILDMVEVCVSTEYDALLALVNKDTSEENVPFIKFDGTTDAGIHTVILAPEGTFLEGTTMMLTDTYVSASELSGLISDQILKLVAVDIDFGTEPNGSVGVYMDIPDELVPEAANAYFVIHMGENGPELVTSNYLDTTGKGQTVSFTAKHFSSYVVALVNKKYQSTLMRTELGNSSRYTIKTLKANMFDYDSAKIDTVLFEAGTGDGDKRGFVFPVMSGDNNIQKGINLGGDSAKQGILENKLQDDLPVFKYLNGNGGVETGKILFDPDYSVDGKTSYPNVDFEFIYDTENGYYAYNSALNHAQLNKAAKRVELYADTLSMANEQYAAPALNSYQETNSMTNISATATSFSATITSDDPYISFPVNNLDASNVSTISVRARIACQDERSFNTTFTIYFLREGAGWGEDYTISVNYTSSGEWIDFVFDPTTCENWDGTIQAIRLDPIQSFDYALRGKDYTFEIDWLQISEMNSSSDHRNGGYYPFSDITDSVPGRAGQFNLSTWQTEFAQNDSTTRFASRAIFNDANTAQDEKEKHLTFGTVIEQEFYIPLSRKTAWNDEIQFTFNGDDDLWLFIDGELVLDIGGGHTPVSGSINLTRGTSTVNKAITVTGYDTPANDAGGVEVTNTIDAKLCATGIHTMTIFYMERHSGVSNCFMRFNLPSIPESPVTVSKQVQNESGEQIEALKDQIFTFTITAKAQGENQDDLADENLSYKLLNATTGDYIGIRQVSNGQFTLKANQKAEFYIPENYQLTVMEAKPSNAETNGYQFVSAKLNGSEGLGATIDRTEMGKTYTFAYVNQYKPLYGEIIITKSGISGLDNNGTTEKQSSIFHVSGTSDTGIELDMDVVIVGNGSKTIVHVPVGTYTVTELTGWTWRYGDQNEQSATVTGGETATVTFENKREEQYWLSGDNYCKNLWRSDEPQSQTLTRRKTD